MNPLTFLPARSLPLEPAPRPGDRAPGLPIEIRGSGPAVVAFLRHTGCPFAEQSLSMLRDAAARHPEVRWLAISHAPPEATDRWCGAVGGAGGVTVLSDPSRRSYAGWGLGRTNLGHFLGRRSLAAVGRLARRGIRNRHPHGTRWQSAGTFAVDGEGAVRWVHIPAYAGDLPDLESALEALA